MIYKISGSITLTGGTEAFQLPPCPERIRVPTLFSKCS